MAIFIYAVIAVSLTFTFSAYATDKNVAQIENFIRSIIQVITGLAGLIATGFFIAGGFGYITSSGSPEKLSRAKHTLIYSGVGLSIVIASYVISNLVTSMATSAFGIIL